MNRESANHTAALIERIGRLLATEAYAQGLQPVQWEMLRYLHRANRFSKTPAAVTAYLGLTKGTVSQTLNSLECKGLIKRQIDRKDRRGRQLVLTAKGRSVLKLDPLEQTVAVLASLDSSTQAALAQGLERLLGKRLSAQDRQPFGQCRDCRFFARHHPDGGPHYCQLLREKLSEPDAQFICVEQIAG